MKHPFKCALSVALAALLCSPAQAEDSDGKDLARIRTELGAAYYARGQYAVALEELQNALKSDSDYLPAYGVRALVYAELKDFAQAEEKYRKALRIDERNADANHNYGWFLCNRREQPAQALKYFETALRDPLYANPHKTLLQAGVCAHKAGDLGQAELLLGRADLQQPDHPPTLLALAQLDFTRGQYEAARKLLARQARLTAASAESLWLNLRLERKLNQKDAEASYARELQTRFPASPEAALLAQGRFD